jgi:hypothetical protein
MNLTDRWQGQPIVIATMHHKEQVLGPAVERAWGLRPIVPPAFDTDRFGTFTRDRDRAGDQRATARTKAIAALEQTGAAIALASEGSFGPHPTLPFAAVNYELVLLLDRASGLELVGEALSLETNYRQATVRDWAAVDRFAQEVGFPDHGLVVSLGNPAQSPSVVKGIRDPATLRDVAADYLARSPDGTLWLETDMRAMHNPRRMQVIAQAMDNLLEKAQSTCPNCGWPGFWITQRLPGLPCEACGWPTALVRLHRWTCEHCGYQRSDDFPQGQTADPAHCPACNP